MDDLLAFLRAALDEDERVAREAADYGAAWRVGNGAIYPSDDSRHPGAMITGVYGDLEDQYAEHIARWDPARVLAKVKAERRVLDDHPHLAMDGCCGRCIYGEMKVGGRQGWPCTTVRMLAQPYAGRPGWREEWSIES